MTDEEREELMAFLRLDREYGDFVYRTYLDTADSAFIRQLAATIRAQAHEEYVTVTEELVPDDPETEEDDSYTITHRETANRPVDVTLADVRNSSDPDAYVQRDLLVRNVIDYIIDEMGCTYTLTPDLALVNPQLDGVENFLRNTKEGYCVQFASSVALILRELGIPARYVEGYIGNEFTRADREDFIYGGYVRDYNAHAWVEVWFDGVGWITYETTPQYYAGLYGTDSSIGEDPVAPVLPEVDTQPPEESETLPEEDTEETDTEEETTEDPDVATAEVLKKSLLVLGVMAVLAAAAAVIATLVSRARAAEDHRQSNAAHILESGYGERTNEEDRRELALEVSDAVMTLLTLYGLAPKAGEFREEYADRLTAELYAHPTDGNIDGEKTEGKHKNKKQTPAAEEQINLHLALDGMAAEEFGHGMTIPEMKAVAALYLALHSQARRRLTRGERFGLRYWKRKI
jgi:transglutaminase-like putative cysteine protease